MKDSGYKQLFLALRKPFTSRLILGLMIGVYIAVFGYLTWLQQTNFGTFGYDMGIYDQGIWLISQFKTPFLTVRGLNYFGHHVNLITVLFAPFYMLGAGPRFLYLAETIIMALGAIPLWLLARDRFRSEWAALAPAGAYLLFPSLEWINWWHFHPDALIITPLISAWWFASRLNWRWFGVSAAIALSCKEDAALAVLMMGCIIAARHVPAIMGARGANVFTDHNSMPNGVGKAIERKGFYAGAITITVAIAWWLICTKIIIPWANNGVGPFYGNLFPGFGNDIGSVITGIIKKPSVLFDTLTTNDRLEYYFKLLAPVAFLPLLSPATLIGLPQLLVNSISAHRYTHDIKYHYSSIVIAALLLGTVETIGILGRRRAWLRFGLLVLIITFAGWSNFEWSPSPVGKSFNSGIWASPQPKHAALNTALKLVPQDASVTATYYIVPHLTQRTLIYEFPNPFVTANWGIAGENPGDPDKVAFLVLDTTLNGGSATLYEKLTATDGGAFEIIFSKDGIIVAKRRISQKQ